MFIEANLKMANLTSSDSLGSECGRVTVCIFLSTETEYWRYLMTTSEYDRHSISQSGKNTVET